MELYYQVSSELSERLTKRYSTSFTLSSYLFPLDIRRHIYAIYGLVRIADEIVDTYNGDGKDELLDALEKETYAAMNRGYSANPIVHAFAHTAQRYGITETLIQPFFESMHIDADPTRYNPDRYNEYIYGSAEVIGLMCLRVFVQGNNKEYDQLSSGAKRLGAAYQKVNFLRDMAEDYHDLGRIYFPNVSFERFSEDDKLAIIADIERDFTAAKPSVGKLPRSSRAAVTASMLYYEKLLEVLKRSSPETITTQRVRISNVQKIRLLFVAAIKEKIAR